MYILYSPSNIIKLFQYISLLIVAILIILMTVGLFYLIISNTTQGLKLTISYLLISMIILFLIVLYMGCRRVFRASYTISIDDTNLITYQTSKKIVNQFTFSDIASITEKGDEFYFNLKDKSAFYLPYEMQNNNVFFEKLFHNYKTKTPDEELFGELKRKNNRFLTIVIVILLLPFLLIPLLSGNVFVIFVYLLSLSLVFSFMGNTELKKINPDTIEIRKYFKTTIIPKNDIDEVKFSRIFVVLPKGGGTYKHSCELITKSNEVYTFKNSSISSIDLYCYLTFWTNTVNQRYLAKII